MFLAWYNLFLVRFWTVDSTTTAVTVFVVLNDTHKQIYS